MFARNSLFLFVLVLAAAACGDGGADSDAADAEAAGEFRLVSPADGVALLESPPDDLVVLDVRTPEEFAEGHIEGAILVDFYDDDFRDQLAALDTEVPYLVYCRSGNRSGQAVSMMAELGFGEVTDVNGGIVAWTAAGYEVSQ